MCGMSSCRNEEPEGRRLYRVSPGEELQLLDVCVDNSDSVVVYGFLTGVSEIYSLYYIQHNYDEYEKVNFSDSAQICYRTEAEAIRILHGDDTTHQSIGIEAYTKRMLMDPRTYAADVLSAIYMGFIYAYNARLSDSELLIAYNQLVGIYNTVPAEYTQVSFDLIAVESYVLADTKSFLLK